MVKIACRENITKNRNSVSVLGLDVDRCTFMETLDRVEELIREDRPQALTFINAETIMMARRLPLYEDYIRSSKLVVADGMGVVWASRVLGKPLGETVCAVEVLYSLCGISVSKGYGIYLLGGRPGVADRACAELKRLYPGVNIAGFHHGYFSEAEEKSVVKDIKRKRPDILVVCLGMYAQEMWIKKYIEELKVPVCWGSGGTLDMISGHLKRAPLWVHRAGLEWCYRLMLEPWRIKRQYVLPIFSLCVLYQRIKAILPKKHRESVV